MGLLVNMPVQDVCPSLDRFLMNVVSTKLGLSAKEIVLFQSSTGKSALEKQRNVAIDDRFKLKIPVADQFVTWEVVFNCSSPDTPPDFDVDDLDFFCTLDADLVEELLPSLNTWNPRNEKALINVITELRSAYLKYQVDRLESVDNRCAYEYTTLTSEKIPADQVEVMIDGNIINMLIKLIVTMPLGIDEDFDICLLVRYGIQSNARASYLTTSLNFVEYFDITLDLPRNIKVDETLASYTDEVVRCIEDQVITVINNRERKRRQYLFELMKYLGQSVLSFDAIDYFHASFLLESDGFGCLLEITLPQNFPGKVPKYKLVSIYTCNKEGAPFSQNITLPYNESREPSSLLDQTVHIIKTKRLETFKKCHANTRGFLQF